MATYTPVNKPGSPKQDNVGGVSVTSAVWEIGSATLGTADTLQGPTLPANSVVVGGSFACTDLDTSSTLKLNIGDATTAGRYVLATAIGTAGGFVEFAGVSGGAFKNTAATRVDITVPTASAGGVAGGTLALEVRYIVLEPTT